MTPKMATKLGTHIYIYIFCIERESKRGRERGREREREWSQNCPRHKVAAMKMKRSSTMAHIQLAIVVSVSLSPAFDMILALSAPKSHNCNR